MRNSLSILRNAAILLFVTIALFPQTVFAHPGHPDTSGSLMSGILHPLTGIDHLLAMIAAGLWAAQLGGRALLRVPAAFVGVMVVGAALGMNGIRLPFVEGGIIASLLILGLAIAGTIRPPVYVAAAAAGLLALFHGHAHGTELTAGISGLGYGLGFSISTITLHLAGIGLGIGFQRISGVHWIRLAGGSIAGVGLALLIGA